MKLTPLATFLQVWILLQLYKTSARSPIAATVNKGFPTGRHPSNSFALEHVLWIEA